MKNIIVIALIFLLGTTLGYSISQSMPHRLESPSDFSELIPFANAESALRESPADRVAQDQILVYDDRVILNVRDAQWSMFTDTHSMEPVISSTANAIQMVPTNSSQLKVGDIISYESKYADGIFIHRVIDIAQDEEGWYAIVKGDNNPSPDPGRIRFSQIRRVVIAIVY